ncbi:MAG: ABC transporter ATP-binding protein, partial [Acidobacteriota bacterium]
MDKWRKVFPYIGRQWKLVILLVVLTSSYTATVALQPWPLKLLVDYALGSETVPGGLASLTEYFPGQRSAALIILAAALSFIIFLLNSGLNSASSWAWTAAGQGMVFDLAGDLFARMQRLSLSFHNRNHVGDLLNRLMGDAYCIYSIADALIVSPAFNLLTLVVLGSISWSLDPQLTILSLIAAPVMAWSSRYFGRKMKRRAKQDQQAKSRLSIFVQQTLTSIPVMQAFSIEDRNRGGFRNLAEMFHVTKNWTEY